MVKICISSLKKKKKREKKKNNNSHHNPVCVKKRESWGCVIEAYRTGWLDRAHCFLRIEG